MINSIVRQITLSLIGVLIVYFFASVMATFIIKNSSTTSGGKLFLFLSKLLAYSTISFFCVIVFLILIVFGSYSFYKLKIFLKWMLKRL